MNKELMHKKKEIVKIIKLLGITLLLLALLKGIMMLAILIALSIGLSFFINNFPIRQLGLELVTFIAVLTGLKYGPWIALTLSFVLILYHLVAAGYFGAYWLWVIPAYCVAAIISGFLPQADVIQLGLFMTFAININNLIFTAMTSPSFLPRYLPYSATNIIFNVVLFTIAGKPMLILIR